MEGKTEWIYMQHLLLWRKQQKISLKWKEQSLFHSTKRVTHDDLNESCLIK